MKLNSEEYRKYMRENLSEFRIAYLDAIKDTGQAKGTFVDASQIAMTGIVLNELARAKLIEAQGFSYR